MHAQMTARMDEMVNECRMAEQALNDGEHMVSQASTGTNTSATGSLTDADRRLTEAKTHMARCTQMMSDMRAMHQNMRGGAGTSGTNPRTDDYGTGTTGHGRSDRYPEKTTNPDRTTSPGSSGSSSGSSTTTNPQP
jgi:hypothetical protein